MATAPSATAAKAAAACRLLLPRLVLAVVATAALTFVLSGAALAYAGYARSNPGRGDILQFSPPLIEIFTSQDLDPNGSNFIQVQNNNADRVDTGDSRVDPANPRRLVVGMQKNLNTGRYIVSFVTQSLADHQADRGQYSFYVTGQPSKTDRDNDARLSVSAFTRDVQTAPVDNTNRNLSVAVIAAAAVVICGVGSYLALKRR